MCKMKSIAIIILVVSFYSIYEVGSFPIGDENRDAGGVTIVVKPKTGKPTTPEPTKPTTVKTTTQETTRRPTTTAVKTTPRQTTKPSPPTAAKVQQEATKAQPTKQQESSKPSSPTPARSSPREEPTKPSPPTPGKPSPKATESNNEEGSKVSQKKVSRSSTTTAQPRPARDELIDEVESLRDGAVSSEENTMPPKIKKGKDCEGKDHKENHDHKKTTTSQALPVRDQLVDEVESLRDGASEEKVPKKSKTMTMLEILHPKPQTIKRIAVKRTKTTTTEAASESSESNSNSMGHSSEEQ